MGSDRDFDPYDGEGIDRLIELQDEVKHLREALAAEQAARAAAERERDALVAACERLVAALDREKEAIVRAFHFAQVHGHRYNGAGYVEELNATRAALAALGPAPTPTTPTH